MNLENYVKRNERKTSRTENGATTNGVSPRRICALKDRFSRQQHNMSLPVTGGAPITETTAIALRRIVFGECPAPVKTELFNRGPGLVFREAERELSYALVIGNPMVLPLIRSILMALQAHILRVLLYDTLPVRVYYRPNPLRPTFTMQQDALCQAITDILWKAGGGQRAALCLPHPTLCYVRDSDHFNGDGLTERINVFEFKKRDDLFYIIRRYLAIFQEDPGPATMLLVYSAILSRGIEMVIEDMGTKWDDCTNSYQPSMFGSCYDVSFSALNLFLWGKAASFLHNGMQYRHLKEDHVLEESGIMVRSPIGLLIWMKTEEKTASYNLGSRLKTPLYPIWLVVASDHSGVLFSADRDLLRNYRSELRFELNYYTSSHHQLSPAVLVIRTRARPDSPESEENSSASVLDRVIRTKWTGARVFWNGQTPFY